MVEGGFAKRVRLAAHEARKGLNWGLALYFEGRVGGALCIVSASLGMRRATD